MAGIIPYKKVGNWPTQRPMPCTPFSNSCANFREGHKLGPKTYKCDIRVSGVHILVKHAKFKHRKTLSTESVERFRSIAVSNVHNFRY